MNYNFIFSPSWQFSSNCSCWKKREDKIAFYDKVYIFTIRLYSCSKSHSKKKSSRSLAWFFDIFSWISKSGTLSLWSVHHFDKASSISSLYNKTWIWKNCIQSYPWCSQKIFFKRDWWNTPTIMLRFHLKILEAFL